MQTILKIGPRGAVSLPDWAINVILKGVRSKKRRVRKRVLKRRFSALVREAISEKV